LQWFYRIDDLIAEDVRKEQQKINEADIIVFIYPDFWTAAPAMLEGWFQRVWTYGFAYGDNRGMKTLDKAIFLITMGGSLNEEIRRSQLEAMRTVMIGDRIRDRSRQCEVYVFDEMTRGYGNTGNRENRIKVFLRKAYDLGKEVKTAEEGDDGRIMKSTKLTVIVDNIPNNGIYGEWGLSILAEYKDKKSISDIYFVWDEKKNKTNIECGESYVFIFAKEIWVWNDVPEEKRG